MSAQAEARQVECELTHGGRVLVIESRQKTGVRKDGSVRYRSVRETYLVERQPTGFVDLVKSDGEVYTVGPFECGCRDWQYKHPSGGCKHQLACARCGLFDGEAR